VVGGAAAQTGPTTNPAAVAAHDLSRRVDRLVDDLGAVDGARRGAAAAALREIGVEALPLLEPHRDHPDAEVAAAVQTLIASYGWLRDGAIVAYVMPNTAAQRAGLRVGDVIAKVDETDVTAEWEVDRARSGAENTFHVWRDGKVFTARLPAGWIGTSYGGWRFDKGGVEHARGVALAATPAGHAEAYRLLLSAWRNGMDDPWALGLVASLAERHLDHATAMVAYGQMHGRLEGCWRTHASTDLYYYNLPFNGPHADHLLTQLRRGPLTGFLAHELFDFATRHGRNLPLARDLEAMPQVNGAAGNPHWRFFDMAARVMVAHHDRRWDDALGAFDNAFYINGTTQDLPKEFALRSAVAAGRTGKAAEIGADAARRYAGTPNAAGTIAHALYALAAASAAGDAAAERDVAAALQRLNHARFLAALALEPREVLLHPGVVPAARRLLEATVTPADPAWARELLLAVVAGAEELTADDWARVIDRWGRGLTSAAWHEADLTARLRVGDYGVARKAVERLAGPAEEARARREMIGKIEAQAAAWAALEPPLTQVVRVEEVGGATWAARHDGRLFRIDGDGKAREFAGLPPPSRVPSALRPRLAATRGRTTLCLPGPRAADRQSYGEFYVLDEAAGRWVDATALPADAELLEFADAHATATLALLRHADKAYPLTDGLRRRFHAWRAADAHTLCWLEGNTLLVRDARTGAVRDLGDEIATAAKRLKRVDVYAVPPAEEGRLWIPTSAGLWRLDLAEGGLSRIPLGLKDEDVPVVPLTEPQRVAPPGARLFGVAPQHGGQVVAVDVTSGAATATGGFCGLGPDDWFGVHRTSRPLEVWQAVDRLYRARRQP
jgi:hypothetical protein